MTKTKTKTKTGKISYKNSPLVCLSFLWWQVLLRKHFTDIPGLRQSIKMKCDCWLPFKDLQCSLSHFFLEFINNFGKKWTVGIICQNVTCQACSEPENTNLFCKSNHHLHEKWIYVASFCSDAKSSPYIFYLANFFSSPSIH